ncbi:MAG: T9SS type A sorting domain-containing protein, partial [Candidatus Cloacimonetes bacterium]|nr:T9SS type A sorting domain-containing protein [Candidatus Cloacimonadota bacterium]
CWEMTDNYGNPISEGYYEVTGFLASYDNIPVTVNIEYLPADVDNPAMIPSEPMLLSSPNPFKSSTTISFSIHNNSVVELTVYNLKGQKVKTLTEDRYAKGDYSVVWDGCDDSGKPVSPGVYFYKLAIDGELVAVKKCIILR